MTDIIEIPAVDALKMEQLPEEHRLICGAKKTNGDPCRNAPMANGRCRLHGGKSLSGALSPTFKHGKRSKYEHVPNKLAKKLEEMVNDPELLSLRSEIAIIRTRIDELLASLDSKENIAAWEEASKRLFALTEELALNGYTAEASAELFALQGIIDGKRADYFKWSEISNLTERLRRLTESEQKRVINMKAMLSAQDAYSMYYALARSVKENVNNGTILAAINADFRRILSERNISHDTGIS